MNISNSGAICNDAAVLSVLCTFINIQRRPTQTFTETY